MTRIQRCRNIIYGVGALGGTVAVFATVLETFYGDNQKMSLRWAQLSQFFYLSKYSSSLKPIPCRGRDCTFRPAPKSVREVSSTKFPQSSPHLFSPGGMTTGTSASPPRTEIWTTRPVEEVSRGARPAGPSSSSGTASTSWPARRTRRLTRSLPRKRPR